MNKIAPSPRPTRPGRIGAKVSLGSLNSAMNTAPIDDGQPAKLATIPLAQIELDVNQVRKLGFSPGEIADYQVNEGAIPEAKRAQFDKLQGLAGTIEAEGLLHPIRLVQIGAGQYRVLLGERRFLAHVLLKKTHIRAFVVSENRSSWSKQTVQLVENTQQEALNLSELVGALTEIADDYRTDQGRYPDVGFVQSRLGQAQSTSYRYRSIMCADRTTLALVRRAIDAGQITNLKRVAELCGLCPKEAKAALNPKDPGKRYSLGGTRRPEALCVIARHLEALIAADDLPTLSAREWADPERVAKHLKALIGAVEAQCE